MVKLSFPSANVMEVKPAQFANAPPPRVLRFAGSTMEVRAVPLNALTPISVSVEGSVMLAREEQFSNAFRAMLSTPSGSITVSSEVQPAKSLVVTFAFADQVTFLRDVSPDQAKVPTVSTVSGRTTSSREVQFWKA